MNERFDQSDPEFQQMLNELAPFFNEVNHLQLLDLLRLVQLLSGILQWRLGNPRMSTRWLFENSGRQTFPGTPPQLNEMVAFFLRDFVRYAFRRLDVSNIERLSNFTPKTSFSIRSDLWGYYSALHDNLIRMSKIIPESVILTDPDNIESFLLRDNHSIYLEEERMQGLYYAIDNMIVPWIAGRSLIMTLRQYY